MTRSLYAESLDEKRRSALLASGAEIGLELALDLPLGDKSIGYYDYNTKTWTDPGAPPPLRRFRT